MNYDMFSEIDYFTNLDDNQFVNNDMLIQNNNMNINTNLFKPYEGYLKGNLFKNLYNDYKFLQPETIKVNNEREEMLLNIGQISFARHELNLLLDNYPNNENMLRIYNQYNDKENELVKNYERRFGPLTVSSTDMNKVPFAWENDKWPWEL